MSQLTQSRKETLEGLGFMRSLFASTTLLALVLTAPATLFGPDDMQLIGLLLLIAIGLFPFICWVVVVMAIQLVRRTLQPEGFSVEALPSKRPLRLPY